MSWTIGIDEAGRGPLAGPVAVGLVRIPEGFDVLQEFPGVNDSKKLSEKKREYIFELLQERVRLGDVLYVVQLKSAQDIDTKGIAVVIRAAIDEGLSLISTSDTDTVWLDGALRAPSHYTQETVIGGDALVPAIMLASVAAKVVRDRHMHDLHAEYPSYGFDQHKGYGTKAHMESIRTYGASPIHRTTFIHLDKSSNKE